ncbi:septal ring lytic transglycosylase RlpA family protein [Adhaeribacter radiodurans]|uniref:LysM peptidoglycan-binding domain-containing protein n=1 Tax=Adhaeribacter radiodurans TaxID=2745197 RepID=A0A7L7LAL0_9BACT|nr:LysM peptidoglycan-binding domain-containing protein [Adhaeribacter radiodurans]QMU29449.1 LysM peptidoglycan-binding domain-containing protein [Adhaeribacter radiodurans]
MIKGFLAAVFTCGFIQVAQAATPALVDSVGTVVKNGKSFTVHKVAPKETIYALARRYGVSVTQVQQANPGVTSLVVGQTVFVPSRGIASSAQSTSPVISQQKEASASVPTSPGITSPTTGNESSNGNKVHQVGARQTLYSIARQYNVSTSDIKKWNNLASDDLQEGQSLVVAPPVTSSGTSTSSPVTIADEEKAEEKVVSTTPTASTKPVTRREEIKSATASVATRDNSDVKEERTETRYTENLSRISESGMAEIMDKAEGNKYLALHKTAPVGTILQVKNTLNNQSVYVRVSGKLPENSTNDRVIIRVSKRAYQKLAASDSRFQVEVNYMP